MKSLLIVIPLSLLFWTGWIWLFHPSVTSVVIVAAIMALAFAALAHEQERIEDLSYVEAEPSNVVQLFPARSKQSVPDKAA